MNNTAELKAQVSLPFCRPQLSDVSIVCMLCFSNIQTVEALHIIKKVRGLTNVQ